jgi:signal transduction histidine kinase
MEFDYFDEVVFPVIVTNYNGDVQYLNNALSVFLGRSIRQLQKEGNIKKIFPALSAELDQLISSSKEKLAISDEIEIQTEREPKIGVFRCRHKREFIIFHLQDLTVERRLYVKYRQKMDEMQTGHHELVQAGKIKAVGELAAMIAHEINNPLTIALGNAELLKFALEDSKSLSKKDLGPILENTHEALERMKSVIAGMRSFVLNKEVEKRYVDLQVPIKKCLSFMQRAFDDAEIALTYSSSITSAIAFLEESKFEQVIINLLQNALDACREARRKGQSRAMQVAVKLSLDEEGLEYRLQIADTGTGIEDKNREQIFQTFFSTKGEEGTGLGLTIAQKILEAHQGTLTLEQTQLNQGSVFCITLPGLELASLTNNQKLYETGDNCGLLVLSDSAEMFNLLQTELKEFNCISILSDLKNIQTSFLQNYPIDYVLLIKKVLGQKELVEIQKLQTEKKAKIFEVISGTQLPTSKFTALKTTEPLKAASILSELKKLVGKT